MFIKCFFQFYDVRGCQSGQVNDPGTWSNSFKARDQMGRKADTVYSFATLRFATLKTGREKSCGLVPT